MSMNFNPTLNQYLYSDSSLVTAAPLSMACWFNADDAATLQTLMAITDKDSGVDYFAILIDGATAGDPIQFSSRQDNTGHIANSTSGYTAGTWHHALGVELTDSSRAIYIDGGNKGTDTSTCTPDNMDSISIAALRRDGTLVDFDGRLAEVAIWNAALTDGEALILAKGYSPLLVRPQSLVFYAPLITAVNPSRDIRSGLSLTWGATPTTAAHPRVFYPGLS